MRPLKTNEEAFGMDNLTGGNSLVPAVQELWNTWEIHCLILLSLSLQTFLFVFADMRRRSSSRVLSTVLWLAYLAADSVAIFVLGHLAVHAGQPRHQLMSFWAPFVLVHLGGQDTITAFSKQDNELWKRHLLGLVTQVAVAGYVVAKASWPDARLRAAVVLVFVSGCFRYAERTYCLYCSSPAKLRSDALDVSPQSKIYSISKNITDANVTVVERDDQKMRETLDNISKGGSRGLRLFLEYPYVISDLLSDDVPVNRVQWDYEPEGPTWSDWRDIKKLHIWVKSVGEDHLQSILQQFLASPGRCRVYEHVGALLVHVYQTLYTKITFRKVLYIDSYCHIYNCLARHPCTAASLSWIGCINIIFLLYGLFQFASAPIALVLFWAAQKGHQDPADITVSYILLIGAIALDVFATISTFPNYFQAPAAWYNKKQWSEKLGQYSIINSQVGLPEVTHTPMSKDDDDDDGSKPSPIKEFILDNLLGFGTRKQWKIASFRGRWAIKEWMCKHGIPKKALLETTSDGIIDFRSSVLIWHIATDICYYQCDSTDNAASSTSPDDRHQLTKKHKKISRELSNYIMYLIFKCRVMLTTNSQLEHDVAHHLIRATFAAEKKKDIKEFVMKLFDATKNQQERHQEQATSLDSGAAAAVAYPIGKLVQNALSVLPRASELAQELISISDETERWELIASVWAEMVYYTAPRCGAAFHYEHLSTGGEFITHLLLLMYILGPFIPDPDA